MKVKQIYLFFIIILCSTLLAALPNGVFVLAPKHLTINKSDTFIFKLKPIAIVGLKDFVQRHNYIVKVYYEDNPSYPQGCKSFSTIVAEQMEKEGIDVRIRYCPKKDHFYLSVLVILENGSLADFIVDYTANQCGVGNVAPIIESRENLKKRYPSVYQEYWLDNSSVFTSADVNMDNFYLEYIYVVDAILNSQLLLKAA